MKKTCLLPQCIKYNFILDLKSKFFQQCLQQDKNKTKSTYQLHSGALEETEYPVPNILAGADILAAADTLVVDIPAVVVGIRQQVGADTQAAAAEHKLLPEKEFNQYIFKITFSPRPPPSISH